MFAFQRVRRGIVRRSGSVTVDSLLVLTTLYYFNTNMKVTKAGGLSSNRMVSCAFRSRAMRSSSRILPGVGTILGRGDLRGRFSRLFRVEIKHVHAARSCSGTCDVGTIVSSLQDLPRSRSQSILLGGLSCTACPCLVYLSSCGHLLGLSNGPTLRLNRGRTTICVSARFAAMDHATVLGRMLTKRPGIRLSNDPVRLAKRIRSIGLIASHSVALSFTLVLPSRTFLCCDRKVCSACIGTILDRRTLSKGDLVATCLSLGRGLSRAYVRCRDCLRGVNHRLFCAVTSDCVALCLTVIFLMITGAVINIRFLVDRRGAKHECRALVHLKTACRALYRSTEGRVA